ncbi:MAG TPA: cellulase family glycosylhydrolase [Solirubrobacteraceae bacterium]|jgi:hypothetical protein
MNADPKRSPDSRAVALARAFAATALPLLAGLALPWATAADPSSGQARHQSARVASTPARKLALRIGGTRLLDASGHSVHLIGVNRSGTQYMCVLGKGIFDGPSDRASIEAIKTWSVNTVRLPLNEDCWLGINGVNPAYSGTDYRVAIETYVRELNRAGLYVILDVHWSAPGAQLANGQQDMLDASHGYTLWRSIAKGFRTYPAVLFDLYNEPHTLGATAAEEWRCWAAGCGAYAGMRPLVRTIRAVGAHNVILLGGLAWASDESGWLAHKPVDPIHQLAAAFHVYREHSACTDEACWSRTLLALARHVPVVDAEFGEMQCGEASALAWLSEWMTYATRHGISVLAWSWNAKGGQCGPGPLLIASYDGAPTAYGAAVKAFFVGQGRPAP